MGKKIEIIVELPEGIEPELVLESLALVHLPPGARVAQRPLGEDTRVWTDMPEPFDTARELVQYVREVAGNSHRVLTGLGLPTQSLLFGKWARLASVEVGELLAPELVATEATIEHLEGIVGQLLDRVRGLAYEGEKLEEEAEQVLVALKEFRDKVWGVERRTLRELR